MRLHIAIKHEGLKGFEVSIYQKGLIYMTISTLTYLLSRPITLPILAVVTQDVIKVSCSVCVMSKKSGSVGESNQFGC